jgi:NAD(P)-dependent dehydrogenase (short-subunit alcohol dehydrogenase family)
MTEKGKQRLKGKTAIITGGDSGIGRAAAIMFAREGASGITITYLPEEETDAKDAKEMIEDSGAKCNAVAADLMDQAACKKLVDDHLRSFGKVDILANNASKQL